VCRRNKGECAPVVFEGAKTRREQVMCHGPEQDMRQRWERDRMKLDLSNGMESLETILGREEEYRREKREKIENRRIV